MIKTIKLPPALADRPDTPDGIAITVVSLWRASETNINLAASKRETLIARITQAIIADRHQRDTAHEARVTQLRQTARYFHKHQDELIAFIAEREIEQFATSNAYLCHTCGRYDHRPEDIKHADDCKVARFLAWRAMDQGESEAAQSGE